MGNRNYEDLCGSARAMDTVGERWALLVVRELLLGPKRFGDLSAGLPRASQNVLSQRLKELASAGVIRRVKMGPPVSTHVYELTAHGRALEPALIALARWGSALPTSPNATMSPDALALGLKVRYRPSADDTRHVTVGLRLGDDPFSIIIGPDGLEVRRGEPTDPRFTAIGDATDVWKVLVGAQPLEEAVEEGAVVVDGDTRDAETFFELFASPPGRPRLDDVA